MNLELNFSTSRGCFSLARCEQFNDFGDLSRRVGRSELSTQLFQEFFLDLVHEEQIASRKHADEVFAFLCGG